MTTKIIAKCIDRGFGFPVLLEQVPMVQFRGKSTRLSITTSLRALSSVNSQDSMGDLQAIKSDSSDSTSK